MREEMMKRILLIVFLLAFALPFSSFGQSRTVFTGLPNVKISEGGSGRLVEAVPRSQAANLQCVISEIGGKYYWATRGNKELSRNVGGAFITYTAVDGSGYVRIIDPQRKSIASSMSETEATFDYVEHALLGLRSVTYYGNAN